MAVWLLTLVISGCLAFSDVPTPKHPSQDLIDGAVLNVQTDLEAESRIVGGSSADISDYPWQASLRSSGSHICGAIILNENFILTAAHCVGSHPSYYTIFVGSSNRQGSDGRVYSVDSITMHPRFVNSGTGVNGAFPNDVAVIKLSSPMAMGSNVQAIGLTAQTNAQLSTYNEADCVITGWGRTNGNGGNLPTTLQMTNVKILTDSVCKSVLGSSSSSINDDIHICVDGQQSSGGCFGDSGGPLACKVGNEYELAGVTSFVFGSCLTSYPTVYAETYTFRTWIENTMDLM